MDTLINYILRFVVILFGALEIRYAIKWYHNKEYYLCGFNIMFAVYMAIYLFKLSMVT